MRASILIFAFRYRKITIDDKNEGFINSISSEIVNALNIDEIRDNFDLKRFI